MFLSPLPQPFEKIKFHCGRSRVGGAKKIAGAQWKQDVNLLLIRVFEGRVFDSISIPLLFWNLISRLD